jgi:hypothetical protein
VSSPSRRRRPTEAIVPATDRRSIASLPAITDPVNMTPHPHGQQRLQSQALELAIYLLLLEEYSDERNRMADFVSES